MKAVYSVTNNDLYLFFMPIVAWSWKRIGVDPFVFYVHPEDATEKELSKFILAGNYMPITTMVEAIRVKTREEEATFSQVARLYAGAHAEIPEDEVLITADADMAVFGDYLLQANSQHAQVFGHDLVEDGQVPICYVSMPARLWRQIMKIDTDFSPQSYLDELLGPKICEHMRGNYWALDQETLHNRLRDADIPIIRHGRANLPHRFATRRADRDSWPQAFGPEIIDAHLPRPGYTDANFQRVLHLFTEKYPGEDFTWMVNYRNEYMKLL